ncbi:hypothetical protein QFZ77_005411 [Paenibacillus sp. V4I3]|uniref:hypothetical protein n=1 Tax=Paenibacillus sp. V4I3 TaxID=3042305 RepID=UPI002786555E|nr:hypothetical protein [Paenibacillus sp. V4I3]MDQ0876752.1 hypothetical protein [Paenibacillus sp. V4I3]
MRGVDNFRKFLERMNNMQYVWCKKINGDIGEVDSIWVNKAFIPEYILPETIEVSSVPPYPNLDSGKEAKQFIRISTKEIYYEIFNRPLNIEEQVAELSDQNIDTMLAITEIYEMLIGGN